MVSELGPKRAKEWRISLETLAGCIGTTTFVLGDEPEDLIEDITSKIAIEIEMENEEECVDADSST